MKGYWLNTGPGGMAHHVARQQMEAAKRRCGGSEGTLVLTRPSPEGNYLAVFENDRHANEFWDFMKQHTVSFTVASDEVLLKLRRVSAQTRLADALGTAQRKRTGPFSGRRPFGPL